jgi:hypothetical protein
MNEQDYDKLSILIEEINRLLDEKDARLRAKLPIPSES